MGEEYVGCFKDNAKRDLPTFIKKGFGGNHEKCFKAGLEGGFKFVGL